MVYPVNCSIWSANPANPLSLVKNRACRGFFSPGKTGYLNACATLIENLIKAKPTLQSDITNNEDYAMGITDRPYSEKRDFIRMKIGAPLNAKIAAESDIIEGTCIDLSGGGLQVEVPQALAVGTLAEVDVSSGHGHNPTLKANVKVVRAAPSEDGKHLLGLEIISIRP
jgi:hypothetical protein